MSSGKPAKGRTRKSKKLALNKRTLKDLHPGKRKADDVRGGRATIRGNCI